MRAPSTDYVELVARGYLILQDPFTNLRQLLLESTRVELASSVIQRIVEEEALEPFEARFVWRTATGKRFAK